MFDYSILKRPIFSYAYDYEEYQNRRGIYIDIKTELPNSICEKEDDYEICPIQCAVFLPENEEFMRIKNVILNCTKRLSELQKS